MSETPSLAEGTASQCYSAADAQHIETTVRNIAVPTPLHSDMDFSSAHRDSDENDSIEANGHVPLERDMNGIEVGGNPSSPDESSGESSTSSMGLSPLVAGSNGGKTNRPIDSSVRHGDGLMRPRGSGSSGDGPSNERLLGTAFCSFMSFALLQLIFAFIAGSQAMMGDSAAMIVDALTYLFNWIAERRKNRLNLLHPPNLDDPEYTKRIERSKRKSILQLEVIPPSISLTCLLVVIVFVLIRAIHILILDAHRSRSEQHNPNVGLMFAFSVFNLALDGLNVFCFARASHLLGYETNGHSHSNRGSSTSTDALSTSKHKRRDMALTYRQVEVDDNVELSVISSQSESPSASPPSSPPNGEVAISKSSSSSSSNSNSVGFAHSFEDADSRERANLNMCSAYTHVFADTLRSVAVIIAAGLAAVVPGVTPEEADAAAAVAVSTLILLSLVPLAQGLMQSLSELRSIHLEERDETMFPRRQEPIAEVC